MIRQLLKLDPRRTGPLDFALTAASTGLALFSLSMSIGSSSDAIVLIGLSTAGTLLSFILSRFAARSLIVKLDGLIYALVAVFAFIFREKLSSTLPDNLFVDRALVMAGALCWMLALGSFVTWRDATLLFQAVPSLALFGLVGCFDLFKDATFLFYIFLLCQATLMARAHGRMMMQQAEASGYSGVEHLNEGPWRWMAGPEWALASALAIVLVSMFGAPVIQDTAKTLGISGFVSVPKPAAKLPPIPSLFAQDKSGGVDVGRGPSTLTKQVLFRATMPWNYYLRCQGYYEYTGRGWQTYFDAFFGRPRETIKGRRLDTDTEPLAPQTKKVDFAIEEIGPLRPFLPVPGVAGEVSEPQDFARTFDGSLALRSDVKIMPKIVGSARELPTLLKPPDAAKNLDPAFDFLTDATRVPKSVSDLAKQVTAGARNDYEKAERIKAEIERRCKYNLNAVATPINTDPIEYFLFKSHEGYCDLFASSMVAMARSVGLPARYEVGYLPDPDTVDGYYIVKESDAHAWAEICFKDGGWITFDPSIGAVQVPDGKRGDSTEKSFASTPWFKYLALPLALLGIGLLGVRFVRNRKAGITRPSRRQEVGKVYGKFERVLQRGGHPRQLSQTPGEYLHANERRLGQLRERAREINHHFEEALYGTGEPSPEAVASLRKEVADFKSQVKQESGVNEVVSGRR